MTYRGKIRNGVVILEGGTSLPDGTEVDVQPAPIQSDRAAESLQKTLLNLAGTLKGYPRDLSRNHDHYIHGTRKEP